ncbi:UDP-glucose 4-epimerase GalE [Clostridium sp. SYSU_GA19001]|uniref:UDP-glucose 4-epimerase GalE n=1 Tax=Clostridium caldaquaticum TaxID=2940653 RepID=UPI00207752FE|nr:UDP-glucose 4-epimerase GalE [Clostridium caldaquaticum]MCM8709422.1 UDP-glucose 4-epimerase GalE [Clostridium caldaquaticum]
MKVLVTGGAGYIGSTVCSALIDKGHTPVILDSLVTGRKEFTKDRIFYKGDIADSELLQKIFKDHPEISHTVHCAALIVVPESVERPYDYYRENVAKSLELFNNLNKLGCKNIIFSSSASIYDDVEGFMVTEKSHLNPRSPYARTKYMMEMILKDFCTAYGMKGIALRYFNPIGADPKMRSGVHIKFPSHVLGKLVDVALGASPTFYITGTNYDTRDGSGIRDYIHVWDLAQAHVKAIENFDDAFNKEGNPDYLVINLGTGRGVTVKELVSAFEKVYNQTIDKEEVEPRPGDVPGAYANADTAWRLLGWRAEKSIEEGIADALKWGEIRESIIRYE